MSLTPNRVRVLRFLRRYYYARASQVRAALFPQDKDGSVTRENMRKLLGPGYVRRHEPRLLEEGRATAPPVYVLTLRGASVLAAETGDASLLLAVEPTFRDWMSLNHFCALTTLHWTIDTAVAAQSRTVLHGPWFEHEVVCPDAAEPARRYKLYTTFPGSDVKCCPDSAFELEVGGARRGYYVEREMGSDTPARVAAKKHKGYALLCETGAFRAHLPHANDFRVLALTPNPGWRDALRREMAGKPGAHLWLFAATPELTAQAALHGPVLWTIDRGPFPLVPPPEPAAAPAAGAGAGPTPEVTCERN